MTGAPVLEPRFRPPPGLGWGQFTAADGAILRWARLGPTSPPRVAVVLLGGFSEFIEKYFETMADMTALDADVWCLDWRGQGGSPPHESRPGPRDYGRDAADLIGFVDHVLGARLPRVAAAHSMGAAIALHALRGRPDLFAAAALSAPMLALASPIPAAPAEWLARAAVALGAGRVLLPGTRMWPPGPDRGVAHSITSSDPARDGLRRAWFAARPDLRIDGVTFAWLAGAFAFCRRLNRPEVLAAIRTPVLLGIAGQERFVDPAALRRAATRLPNVRVQEFTAAKHELFMEADAIRAPWLAAIAAFTAEHATGGP
ncbi:MAG: alpha/beta hydrolase [Rhodospirillaceae bacterium]|nr:alpha/beta hydrolase [Rhodospirillaceae bacterium]